MDGAGCLAVVLAAGEGTRMRSATPKVLHRLAGRTMLAHVLDAARAAGDCRPDRGRDRPWARAMWRRKRAAPRPGAEIVVQRERLGTAHAVLAARAAIARGCDHLLVLVRRRAAGHARDASVLARSALGRCGARGARLRGRGSDGLRPPARRARRTCGDPRAQGRERGRARRQALQLGADGTRRRNARSRFSTRIGRDNAQGEYYLTDAVASTRAAGRRAVALPAEERETMGVNDRVQLAAAEAAIQQRLREAAMRAGATLQAPETVFLSHDTRARPRRRRSSRTSCSGRA